MSATLAVVGADVITMDPALPRAAAIAVNGDRIVAVGSDAEVRAACGRRTEIVDGRGWTVTPGLTDGHQHLLRGAELGQAVDLEGARDLDAVRGLLHDAAQELPPDAWLRGYGFEYRNLGQGFHHTMLDGLGDGRPLLVHSLDLHSAYLNGEAVRRARISGPRTFPDASQIVCDDDGPTGELRERSAIRIALDAMPKPTAEERRRRAADAIARQNSVGITAIHQMDGDPASVDCFRDLEDAGLLNLHVAIHNVIAPDAPDEYVEELVRGPRWHGRRWRADGVKFWMDGVVETGTAWLEEADRHGGGTTAMWPLDRYATTARRCHDAGLRIATHAIGDRAIREVLDVYAALPGPGGPHRIEHVETAPDATIARFRPQGVTASMQPIHLKFLQPDRTDLWSQRLGDQHCDHAMRSGDIAAAGARVVLGSDWPVATFDPRPGMYAARLRRAPRTDPDTPIGASRPLSGHETLAGYTVNASEAIGDQDAGMLRAGRRADLVAWADDPVRCDPADVLTVPVVMTLVDGTVVHRC